MKINHVGHVFSSNQYCYATSIEVCGSRITEKEKKNDGYTLCVQQMENLSSCRWSSVAQKNSTIGRWAMLKLKLRSSI